MTEEEAKELLRRYEEGECSPEECLQVESWYNKSLHQAKDVGPADFDAVKDQIWQRLDVPSTRGRSNGLWLAAAAVIAILFIPIALLLNNSFTRPKTAMEIDIPAGSSRAMLTLADGKKINLDEVQNGQIASLPGLTITKTDSGRVVYQVAEAKNTTNTVSYNTISTPRGGQFQVILPDGTEVFLNSESSLKYPTNFANNKREVTLTGEAFFGVQKNPQKPFVVLCSERQMIMVLGTHFNVSGYPDEAIKTTLEEGKVKVSKLNSTQNATLKPGDQSIVTSQGIEVRQVNLATELAWKRDMFIFRSTSMKEVMKQFSRWYDVDVDYSTIPDHAFYGDIPRNLSLLKVLEIINAYSDYKFTLQERRIVVRK